MRMKEKRLGKGKRAILTRLVDSARMHNAAPVDTFLCPVCLTQIPTSEASKISEAHIVPRAASGGMVTLLCKSCNSRFGARQDKWMGEYLRLRQLPDSFILQTRHQKGHFTIGGIRVSGDYRVGPDRGVELFVWKNRSSPDAVERLADLLSGHPEVIDLSLPSPLLENRRLIDVGLLTAGYLLWFRGWTYSWALQRHLEPIRRQILEPDCDILDRRKFVGVCRGFSFSSPTIGVGMISEHSCLFAGIGDHVVLFPPASMPDLYDHLPGDLSTTRFQVVRELKPKQPNSAVGPFALLFRSGFLLIPDRMKADPTAGEIFIMGDAGEGPMPTRAISQAEFDELKDLPNAHVSRMSLVPDAADPTAADSARGGGR